MLRLCKQCLAEKPYDPLAPTMQLRGFNGYVCYACYIKEQAAWRKTPGGKYYNTEASKISRKKKKGLQ